MSGTNTSQLGPALRKDLLKGMALWDSDNLPNEGDQLVGGNKVNDTQSFIKIAHFTRPTGPQQRDERQPLPEGRYDKVRTAEYSNLKYGLLLSWSREVWADNQYRSVVLGGHGTDLKDLCHDVRDIALVNEFFNLMNSNTGPDGVAYISASHPLDAEAAELTEDNTALASNNIVDDPTVSTEALNDGIDMLKRTRDNKGRINGIVGKVFVECSSKREVLWRSIAMPVNGYEPFTAERNSGAVYSGMIAGVIGLSRAEHDDWFCLRTANSRKMHRFVWDRMTPEVSEVDYVKKDDTYECNVIFRLSKGIFDWRGVVASLAGA